MHKTGRGIFQRIECYERSPTNTPHTKHNTHDKKHITQKKDTHQKEYIGHNKKIGSTKKKPHTNTHRQKDGVRKLLSLLHIPTHRLSTSQMVWQVA